MARKSKPEKEPVASVICPVSGMVLSGRRIKAHWIDLFPCKNGSLTGWCPYHSARVFVSGQDLIREIRESTG